MKWAVIAPIGPSQLDRARAEDLLDSIQSWEPSTGVIFIVDDSPEARTFRLPRQLPQHSLSVIHRPRDGSSRSQFTFLPMLLEAMAVLGRERDVAFAIKADTDALVIGPFAERLARAASSRSTAGLIGVCGDSCNDARRNRHKLSQQADVFRAFSFFDLLSPEVLGQRDYVPGVEGLSLQSLRRRMPALRELTPHVEAAVRGGYELLEYCQGGAYLMTGEFLHRFSVSGFAKQAACWEDLPFYEDVVIPMYCRAVGLDVCDDGDDVFGVQASGLPYPTRELVARGYAWIHSLKRCDEGEISAREHLAASRPVR